MAGTTTYYGVTYPTSTDYVKDGATAIQTVATGFDSAVAIPTYNAQTGATYTFALTDVGKTVTASNAAASTYTIPPTASVAWPTGTTLEVTNLGAGVVTFAAGAGVTVTNTANTLAQYQSANLIRTGLNAWTVTPTSGGSSGLTLLNATTFSASSAVNISNVFSSTYTNYRILIDTLASAGGAVNMKFRENVTDKSTNYVAGTSLVNYLGTAATTGNNNGTQFIIITNSGTTLPAVSSLDLYRTATQGYINGAGYNEQADQAMFTAGRNTSMTNFTGFSIIPGSGTITGSVRVYGYQGS
jgi:hypothetical protein